MWFYLKTENIVVPELSYSQKETIHRLVTYHGCNEKMIQSIKEFSMVQIQNGNYEYGEVLDTLKHKKVRNDKA